MKLLVTQEEMDMFWGQRAGVPAAAAATPSIKLLLERLRNAKLQSDRKEIVQELRVRARFQGGCACAAV